MRSFLDVWYQPVAAVRPRLLARGALLLLAFDIWVLMLPNAGRYGAGGFNVAHFGWLDALQPTPTPATYGVTMILAGGLALVQALVGLRRPLMAALTALYTYGWAMSLNDAYQHHYLISLVLLCLTFLPSDRERPPTVVAWGYQLLLATIGIVYAFAAVAKVDPLWSSGAFLRRQGRREPVTSLVATLDGVGLDAATFWPLLALSTIVLEALLAFAYVAALWRDRAAPSRAWLAWATGFAFAAGMHLGIEAFGLRIGWFSVYMIGFAAVVFLPASWLETVARPLGLGSRTPQPPAKRRKHAPVAAAPRVASTSTVLAAAGAAALALIAGGLLTPVPGATVAALAATVALAAGVVWLLRRGRARDALHLALATAASALLCWLALALSSVAGDIETWTRRDLARRAGTVDRRPADTDAGDSD